MKLQIGDEVADRERDRVLQPPPQPRSREVRAGSNQEKESKGIEREIRFGL